MPVCPFNKKQNDSKQYNKKVDFDIDFFLNHKGTKERKLNVTLYFVFPCAFVVCLFYSAFSLNDKNEGILNRQNNIKYQRLR